MYFKLKYIITNYTFFIINNLDSVLSVIKLKL